METHSTTTTQPLAIIGHTFKIRMDKVCGSGLGLFRTATARQDQTSCVACGVAHVAKCNRVQTSRHQRLKHAAACHSTRFWGPLVGVLKHAAAH